MDVLLNGITLGTYGFTGFGGTFTTLNAVASGANFLEFKRNAASTRTHDYLLDEISVTAVIPEPPVTGVPEPASAGLLALGLLGLAAARRRARP